MRKLLFIIGLLVFILSSCSGPLEVEVSFETNGGSSINSMTFNEESVFSLPNDPVKEGYTFSGWFLDATFDTPFSVEGVIALEPEDNLTVYAQWTINAYTITFDSDGGTEVSAITQDYNTSIIRPTNPTKEGHTFLGWDNTVPTTMPAESLKFTALWEVNQYTITFDTDGGTEVSAITQDYNTAITTPANPTKKGHTFLGWDNTVPTKMPAESMTVTALWQVNQYTIFFVTEEEYENLTNVTFLFGQSFVFPTISEDNKTFIGWFDEFGNQYNSGYMNFDYDIYVFPRFDWKYFNVTLISGEGDLSGELIISIQYNQLFTLEVPSSGKSFSGWYLDELPITDDLGNSLDVFNFDYDIEVYAFYEVEISTVDELLNISNDLEANYRLINDIDLSGINWSSIGSLDSPFNGRLDGDFFEIKNLTFNGMNDIVGLFAKNEGLIKNLYLSNVYINITSHYEKDTYVGALAGYNSGSLKNIEVVSGEIIVETLIDVNTFVGGLVGYNFDNLDENELINLKNYSIVSSDSNFVGGLFGSISFKGELNNLYNFGNVSGIDSVGGLFGIASIPFANELYNFGKIFGENKIGGIIGEAYRNNQYGVYAQYEILENYGEIHGFERTGGLIGYLQSVRIKNALNEGIIINRRLENYSDRCLKTGFIGGLVGVVYSGSISNSTNMAKIEDACQAGGLVGLASNLKIYDSENLADLSGAQIGGIILYMSESELYRTSNYGNIFAITERENRDYVDLEFKHAGIVGVIIGSSNKIEDAFNNGSIDGAGLVHTVEGKLELVSSVNDSDFEKGCEVNYINHIGGLIWIADGANIKITNSENLGNLIINCEFETESFPFSIGGFIGIATNSYIEIGFSYNNGNIYSEINFIIGGLVGSHSGWHDSHKIMINSSYNLGNLEGKNTIGGLVGITASTYSTIDIRNSFNSGNITGLSQLGGIIGKYDSNNQDSYLYIISSFNTGNIIGVDFLGGFIGISNKYSIFNSINYGSLFVTNTSQNVGMFTGNFLNSNSYNNYFYGYIKIEDKIVENIELGTRISLERINEVDFYINDLEWSQELWDLSNLDISNDLFPVLILEII